MNALCTSRSGRRWACMLLLLGGMALGGYGQWNFLGPQWLGNHATSSHGIALNAQQQVHVAMASQGQALVQRYDGSQWIAVGTGLPATGQEQCAIAFEEDRPWLALGPALSVWTLDNGTWQAQPGLPSVAAASSLLLRVGHDDALWLAWTTLGANDSCFIATNDAGQVWSIVGAFPGRLLDFELNEFDAPVALLDGAFSLKRYDNGLWTTMPAFSHTQDRYLALAMTLDGTGEGAVVLRRDGSNALSAELLSNGAWLPMGAVGFADGDLVDLQPDRSGVMHVLSVLHAAQAPPQVWHYLAGSWSLLGGQYVYNNTVSQPRLAFDGATAYALFRDDEQSLASSVMYLGSPQIAPDGNAAPLLALYPNPTPDWIHVRLPRPTAGGMVRVCDALGCVQMQAQVQAGAEVQISVSCLPAGRYWLSLQQGTGSTQVGTFTKQ